MTAEEFVTQNSLSGCCAINNIPAEAAIQFIEDSVLFAFHDKDLLKCRVEGKNVVHFRFWKNSFGGWLWEYEYVVGKRRVDVVIDWAELNDSHVDVINLDSLFELI